MKRCQTEIILNDLKKKVVFLVGPRQVGKTWLALDISKRYKAPVYLNYDRFQDRDIMMSEGWLSSSDLLIFDEIHKMKDWKTYIKGIYDTRSPHQHILVTGSARLEAYHHMGESLAGRYFKHRLLPFSFSELANQNQLDSTLLWDRGGFPEPLMADLQTDRDRWRNQYINGFIREDVFDFGKIWDLKTLQLLTELLKSRTGSPVSYSSIARDIGTSPNTVKKYINILESMFIVFRVTPHSRNIARSLLKEPKVYFFDSGMIEDPGAKIENTIANCLLKHAYAQQDTLGKAVELHYIRTKDGREVDFCITEKNHPIHLLEVKTTDTNLSKSLMYFHNKTNVPATQLVYDLKRPYQANGIEVRRAADFLANLD